MTWRTGIAEVLPDGSCRLSDGSLFRDGRGRVLYGVTPGSSEAEIAQAISRLDAEAARSVAELRRMGRLWNQW